MAIKKSQLYSTIWSLCDDLRGGVDPADYKYYILTLLFVKYISDKAKNTRRPLIKVPCGAGFDDMLALRNKSNIGEGMNLIVKNLADANPQLGDFNKVDFDNKDLGEPAARVTKLTRMINTIHDKLNLQDNHATGDDLLGDAYEYLMRMFAAQAGKNKGQFYTPAEVSRLLAIVCGIDRDQSEQISLHDPTCGSGSLLLRAADVAKAGNVIICGQEFDPNTATLAKMNMVLHGRETAQVEDGDTLGNPKFLTLQQQLRTFDYVVANPPFSQKNWMQGLVATPARDRYNRFTWGTPPEKCGDFAFLLHILAAMKPQTGRGACIMPLGVLSRGNSEALLRYALVRSGWLKAVIGLPVNLFYGTGIAACVLVLDKNHAAERKGIFMIDAGDGYRKDGAKNRLRERDLRRISDTFATLAEVPHYSRMVPIAEIERNNYNLNLPRYIATMPQEAEQDIDAHLNGGIPVADLALLQEYRSVFPQLMDELFLPGNRAGYARAALAPEALPDAVRASQESAIFRQNIRTVTEQWLQSIGPFLKSLKKGCNPTTCIEKLQHSLLRAFSHAPLLDKYAAYQQLMEYYDDTLRDDFYILRADGWDATPHPIEEYNKKGQLKTTGWTSDLLPPDVMSRARFSAAERAIADLKMQVEAHAAALEEMKEEEETDGGFFDKWDKVNKSTVSNRLKAISPDGDAEEIAFLKRFLAHLNSLADSKKALKQKTQALDKALQDTYVHLTEKEILTLVVEEKWQHALRERLATEAEHLTHTFSMQLRKLTERYEHTLPELQAEVDALQAKVNKHLKTMGYRTDGGAN